MPSLARAYTELTPPPPPPGGGAGAPGAAGVGAGAAAPRAGAATPAPRPKMSGNPWSGSPTIPRAALTRLPPPPPRPGAAGRRLVGRVAAAVNPPGQSSDPVCGAA